MVELKRPGYDIGLVVRDFEKAVAFYRDKLGMTPTRNVGLDEESAKGAGIAGGACEIQYMEFGEVNLKLVRFDNPPPAAPFGADGASGIRYLTMWVAEMNSAYEEWKAKGVEFLSAPIRRTPEMQMVFFKDPEGNLFELLGP